MQLCNEHFSLHLTGGDDQCGGEARLVIRVITALVKIKGEDAVN